MRNLTNDPTMYDIDKGDWIEYPQVKVSQMDIFGIDWYDIEKIVRRLHGMYDWQGVRTNGLYFRAGMSHIMRLWLSRNGHSQLNVIELYVGDKESIYYPTYKA